MFTDNTTNRRRAGVLAALIDPIKMICAIYNHHCNLKLVRLIYFIAAVRVN